MRFEDADRWIVLCGPSQRWQVPGDDPETAFLNALEIYQPMALAEFACIVEPGAEESDLDRTWWIYVPSVLKHYGLWDGPLPDDC